MASIHSEYHGFLTYLEQREVHDDVRRFAHLILDHLHTLAEFGSTRRARSKRLVPLVVDNLAQAPIAYAGGVDGPDATPSLERLHQLEVGPFRGFMQRETFDLSHDITLVYGANGTGKSSFFEAIEMAMLGLISEAQAKRVDQREYCNNARLRRHVAPVLSARGANGAEVVRPDESEYRFCFVEKNRLDDFARIAARTPSDQRQLIATLFGMDQFSEFVRGFNQSLDQDLMLVGSKATQLAERRQELTNSENTIAAYPNKITAIESQEHALAQDMWPGFAYQPCVEWLLGTPQQQGHLPYVQAQLDAIPPPIYDVTRERLQNSLAETYRIHGLWQESSSQLSDRAGEVSYAKLYEAVLTMAEGATACPACGTELADVARDPFANARSGLEQLEQLAVLQQQEGTLKNQLNEALRSLRNEMHRAVTVAARACPADLQAADLPDLPPTAEGNWLEAWVVDEQQAWNALLRIVSIIESCDEQARVVHTQRTELAQERDRLEQYRSRVEQLRTMRATAEQELETARQTVAKFEESNRELIKAVEAEVPMVAFHHRIKAAYDGFLPVIQNYLAALPGELLQGLEEQARQLYNAFNREDPPGDLLHALRLPLTENDKIYVEFVGEPGVRYDALIVFSEGHIKCLGLAILLAKNIAQDCSVVIFDDVVNAIDDDHRDGIWRTFFEDGWLDGKQVILTSHAEEFLLRIQQELGAQRAAGIKRYKFLPHEGEHELRVDSNPPVKNYVLLARQALDDDEKREALRHARPALESLTDRLWTWMGRKADGRIELKLGGPRSPWELNNKCSKLRSSVKRLQDQHAGIVNVISAFDGLLGINGGSIEWGYLNSGVHDSRRDREFNRATVRTIVESITELDRALGALQNR